MCEKWLVAGLGNPGASYECTRHNAGFMAIDAMVDKFSAKERYVEAYKSVCSTMRVKGVFVHLIKPMAFMNRSGYAVAAFMRKKGIEIERLIVVSDDVHLEPGCIRLRPGGSSGGHNGLESIISVLGTTEFKRIRIGVGEPPAGQELKDYVLGRLSSQDMILVGKAVERAVDAVCAVVGDSLAKAMNMYN